MKVNIEIKWFDDLIPEHLIELLEKHGIERAYQMLNDNHTNGELIYEYGGKTYRGWWSKEVK